MKAIEEKSINAIKVLSAEGIQKANSGHPGLPLGTAALSYTLWAKHLKHNPANPNWIDRDRFVLSAGHGSMLIYSLLHLFGYGLDIEDLKQFRQWNSKTPGHPEFGHTTGVEVTTGPLGQGIANAVGFAMAEQILGAKFNKPDFEVVDHYTYALAGDGCMMEGISSEAASLAGTLGLNKLIVFYDDNEISIEGDTNIAFRENVNKRFEAYQWNVIDVADGNDIDSIDEALVEAKKSTDKPTLIVCHTTIGAGCPAKQGKASAHGEPLGQDNIEEMKECIGWSKEAFFVPEDVKAHYSELVNSYKEREAKWNSLFDEYKVKYPELAKEWDVWFSDELPTDLLNDEEFWKFDKAMATRASSGEVINRLKDKIPNLIGGSADLAPSNKTNMKDEGDFSKEDRSGRNLHFGVREHAMGAITNAMIIHGGLYAYCATFFVFSDYVKPAMRLSALMKLPTIYVLTHDSIGVGEDGPTHEPIEHLAMLRSIPNFTVIRPADSKETAAAWYAALTRKNSPTGIVLTRQTLPLYDETSKEALKGAYILKDSKENPEIILIATGSEVSIAYEAYEELTSEGINVRLVSMPSFEMFEEQSEEYKESVLPKNITKRVCIEALTSFGWHKYATQDGKVISLDTFGASAPGGLLFKEYGFTKENVVETAKSIL